MIGLSQTLGGDNRYFNNIFVGGIKEGKRSKSGLGIYYETHFPMFVNGNVYLNGAISLSEEKEKLEIKSNPEIRIVEKDHGIYLRMNVDEKIIGMKNQIITSAILGVAKVPNAPFENPDESPISVDKDYFGKKMDLDNPVAGPFSNLNAGEISLKVWPKQ